MEKSILFGNGINRLNNFNDWEILLNVLKGSHLFDNGNVPYSLIYERIVLEKAKRNHKKNQAEKNVREEIATIMRNIIPSDFYLEIFNLNLTHYLTTNYDYAFQSAIKNTHNDVIIKKENSEKLYSVRRRNSILKGTTEICKIWFIHGEIDVPNSIMLGYDMYCKSINPIHSFLKGEYKYIKNGKDFKFKRPILNKINAINNPIESWVDLFFLHDIHILGLSLNYGEIDIWWILNYRAKLIQDGRKIVNQIFFYTNVSDCHLHGLLKVLKVEVIIDANFEVGKWEDHYRRILSKIQNA